MIPDYRDFTIGSMFKGTDQSPARSALLTANWRGCDPPNSDKVEECRSAQLAGLCTLLLAAIESHDLSAPRIGIMA